MDTTLDLTLDPISTEEVGRYFNVEPQIAHLVPELLADLYELGSFPERIVRLLAPLGLPASARVLDLGCGKGAVSLALASEFGVRVEGVDLMEAFVKEARERALRANLGERCAFEAGDMRRVVEQPQRIGAYDVALYVSIGDVLGSMDEAVGVLRRLVRPGGGLMVIDDAYLLEEESLDFPGYEQCVTRAMCQRQLTAHGDQIVIEERISTEETREQNRRYQAWIEARAAELTRRYPQHAAALEAYVAVERDECALLETALCCATWVLRRS